MIEYHTIFILKKTDRFFKTFRSPLPENSAGAAEETPLRSCGSPCIAPSWGDAKCFGGGKTHEIRILTQLCAGQRAKIWRRGKDFFGKSSLKNAHFCYNSSKVPLCGGPAPESALRFPFGFCNMQNHDAHGFVVAASRRHHVIIALKCRFAAAGCCIAARFSGPRPGQSVLMRRGKWEKQFWNCKTSQSISVIPTC
jgi:hypothetical protein